MATNRERKVREGKIDRDREREVVKKKSERGR